MYEYMSGRFTELTPAYVVADLQGLGYMVNISLNTYSDIQSKKEGKLFIHLVVKEDDMVLYGFSTPEERQLFRQLISISGIGPNTARLVLSSLPPQDLVKAIQTENITAIKAIKGIGPKTAERVIIELRDKVGQISWSSENKFSVLHNKSSEEALYALVALGFNKAQSSEIVKKVLKEDENLSVEDVVKRALKYF
jgi:Holliday junction DNA helicase RuvA